MNKKRCFERNTFFLEKRSLVLVFLFTTIVSCVAQKNNSLESFVFESNTRGDRLKMYVNKEHVELTRNGTSKECEITVEDWEKIQTSLSDKTIKNASKYTNKERKRYVDRAKISSIKFKIKEGTYQTNNFDDFNSPSEFKALMHEIEIILEKKCL